MKRITYYAAEGKGRQWAEVLVVRENGRQVSQEPTGVIYPTTKAMQAGLAERNRAAHR